jgi:hypothetical protein
MIPFVIKPLFIKRRVVIIGNGAFLFTGSRFAATPRRFGI